MISIEILSPCVQGFTMWPLVLIRERRERPTPQQLFKLLWIMELRNTQKKRIILKQEQRTPLLLERWSVNLHSCSVSSMWLLMEVGRGKYGLRYKHYPQGESPWVKQKSHWVWTVIHPKLVKMSIISISKKKFLLPLVRKTLRRLDVPLTWLSFQKMTHERSSNGFSFLTFFISWAIDPHSSKVQKQSLKTKDLPASRE